jgi:hypothetical protein
MGDAIAEPDGAGRGRDATQLLEGAELGVSGGEEQRVELRLT